MSCSYRFCRSSKHKKEPGISFHRFPVDQNKKVAWVEAVGRDDWTPSNSAVICSRHFQPEDFDCSSTRVTLLKDSAVPLSANQNSVNLQMEHCDSDDIVRNTSLHIDNVQLKRKLEKALSEKAELKNKIRQQDRVIRQQDKKIRDLQSLVKQMKDG